MSYTWNWHIINQLCFCSFLSGSSWFQGLQHARLPCPSLSPGACSSLCPLVSDATQPSYPLSPLLPLPSIFPSIRVFSIGLALHIRRLKYGSFNLSISPSKEYWGLIFFRTDWFYGLAIQDTLKSLLQHHNSKALILQHSAFFMVQFSHLYMITRKTIALTTCAF